MSPAEEFFFLVIILKMPHANSSSKRHLIVMAILKNENKCKNNSKRHGSNRANNFIIYLWPTKKKEIHV